MADQCIRHLMDEHRAIEAVLASLERLLIGWSSEAPICAERREHLCAQRRFMTGPLLAHIRKEHHILFPALEGFLPRDEGPLDVLRTEHAAIQAHALWISEAVNLMLGSPVPGAAGEEFLRTSRRLLRLTRDHMYKEDRILFPMAVSFLTPEMDADLLRRMENLEPPGDTPGTSLIL
jgi:hemerythrin-like domain-containing protein